MLQYVQLWMQIFVLQSQVKAVTLWPRVLHLSCCDWLTWNQWLCWRLLLWPWHPATRPGWHSGWKPFLYFATGCWFLNSGYKGFAKPQTLISFSLFLLLSPPIRIILESWAVAVLDSLPALFRAPPPLPPLSPWLRRPPTPSPWPRALSSPSLMPPLILPLIFHLNLWRKWCGALRFFGSISTRVRPDPGGGPGAQRYPAVLCWPDLEEFQHQPPEDESWQLTSSLLP